MPASATLQQVNVRLDAGLKRRAEEVLALMGSSATDLIRSAYQKVARGAGDYVAAMEVLKGPAQPSAKDDVPFSRGWHIADGFYESVGYDPGSVAADDLPWDEVYERTLAAHFAEKGVLQ